MKTIDLSLVEAQQKRLSDIRKNLKKQSKIRDTTGWDNTFLLGLLDSREKSIRAISSKLIRRRIGRGR